MSRSSAEFTQSVVVVGAGHAGVQVADSLRSRGHHGPLTLISEEIHLPYQRPPLSKDFMTGGGASPVLPLRTHRFFDDRGITLRSGTRATTIDRSRRLVRLEGGGELEFDALVLATGAVPHTLRVPGSDLAGLHQLRTLDDARGLRAALGTARSVVVVGAGFIGLEFAAAARGRGRNVIVLEAAERPLRRAVTSIMSERLTAAHRALGTDIRLGAGLAALLGRGGAVTTAVDTQGQEHAADLVLVGVGMRPRDELARSAGLDTADGIVVDASLRTSDPAIFAVGDCASMVRRVPGPGLRLESVQNATDQARHVAEVILGSATAYWCVPWFWSYQGPLRLQIAGLRRPDDHAIVSGDVAGGRFSVLCFRDGRLSAVESLNRPADHVAARRVLAAPTRSRPTPEEASSPLFRLKDHTDHAQRAATAT